IAGERILRWTIYDGRVAYEVLPAPAGEVRRCADEFTNSLSMGDRSASSASLLLTRSHQLAQDLLPESVLRGDLPARFLATSDGFLYTLPFALLNLAEAGFQPLVQECDVATVRYWRDNGPTIAPGSALIVTNPRYDPQLRRAQPNLNRVLPQS